jgi:2-haloacid dehalogenase
MSAASVIHADTKAVIFDAYGTIFDVHSAVRLHAGRIGPDAAHLSEIWRAKQLEYSWVLSLAERYEPFSSLTEKALDYTLARYPHIDKSVKPLLLAAYRNLAAFPDVRGALEILRARSLKTGILSNGDSEVLAAAVSSAGLKSLLDEVLSVDSARVFKTSQRAYRLVLSTLLLEADEIVFVSSNRWDVAGATACGFPSVWVNRQGSPDEYAELAPRMIVSSLDGLF